MDALNMYKDLKAKNLTNEKKEFDESLGKINKLYADSKYDIDARRKQYEDVLY